MVNGLLKVAGTLDIDQFWPLGTSDADTTKILVGIGENAFQFRPSPSEDFQVTHAFENATVIGKSRKPPVDKKGRITVRLQGIDAPELHYRPQAALKKSEQTDEQHKLYLKWNLEYRQYYGETATVALREFLLQANQNPLSCTITSLVDSPNDVFDTYGRLVGDVLVKVDTASININHWIVENGFAIPTFYTSMTETEITELTRLTKSAQSEERGFWADFTQKLTHFQWDLEFRGQGAKLNPSQDEGSVFLPKLFRRQATYEVNKRAKMVTGSFLKYLKERPDGLHRTTEFLEQGSGAAPIYYLHQFLGSNRLKIEPTELVFREEPSRLIGPNGQDVHW
jgi:endonuclease YncB( thermonuclease family)